MDVTSVSQDPHDEGQELILLLKKQTEAHVMTSSLIEAVPPQPRHYS